MQRRGVCYGTTPRRAIQNQTKDILGRYLEIADRAIARETEARVIGRIADQDNTRSTPFFQRRKSGPDQKPAKPLALPVGADGNRSQPKPTTMIRANLYRREGNMANNLSLIFGHDGKRQIAVRAQRIDDRTLRPVAEERQREGRLRDLPDGGGISRSLGSNGRHELSNRSNSIRAAVCSASRFGRAVASAAAPFSSVTRMVKTSA